MESEEFKQKLREEPWGKFLVSIGMEPYDTESSVRRVAEQAVIEIAKRDEKIENLEDEIIRLIMELNYENDKQS